MRKPLYKRIVCADGFSMSVQASRTSYCAPRNDTGPYEAVEIGFPTEEESILLSYAEVAEEPTNTVYPYVPSHVVSLTIAKHGGMIEGSLPEGIPFLKADYENS